MKDIHRSIHCHNIEMSIQQLQLDANLFFVEVVSGKSPFTFTFTFSHLMVRTPRGVLTMV